MTLVRDLRNEAKLCASRAHLHGKWGERADLFRKAADSIEALEAKLAERDKEARAMKEQIDRLEHMVASKNWGSDASHENGCYANHCAECGETFIGHKRRVICKVCHNKGGKRARAVLKGAGDAE